MSAAPRSAGLRAAVLGLPPPVDGREERSRRHLLAELERLADPFDEHADPVHVTASGIVLGPRGVLLHRHKRLGAWMQPGGHVDPGESAPEAARREVAEETGVNAQHADGVARLFHVDVHDGGRGHTHLDLRYLLVAGDEDPTPAPGESQAVRWYRRDEALAVADEGLVGALQRLRW